MGEKRFYRNWVKAGDLKAFEVRVFETDLLISAAKDLKKEAEEAVCKYRWALLNYIDRNRAFKESFTPIEMDESAPEIAKAMIRESAIAGVGPMAGVAGAIAEYAGRELLDYSPEVIVENGGDIFMSSSKDRIAALYAGQSPFSGKIALRFSARKMPLGVATSSGTVGHSISFGRADAALVISRSATLADCVATGAANIVKRPDDIREAIDYARAIKDVLGVLIVAGDKMASWGEIELV